MMTSASCKGQSDTIPSFFIAVPSRTNTPMTSATTNG